MSATDELAQLDELVKPWRERCKELEAVLTEIRRGMILNLQQAQGAGLVSAQATGASLSILRAIIVACYCTMPYLPDSKPEHEKALRTVWQLLPHGDHDLDAVRAEFKLTVEHRASCENCAKHT